MGKQKTAEWYDAEFRRDKAYAKPFSKFRDYGMWKKVLEAIETWKGRILELGAGPGQFAAMLEEAGRTEYVGLDFSPVAVEMAAKATKLRIVCKTIQAADLEKDASYDIVIMLEVLEHVTEDCVLLKRLRSGVKAIFTVPAFDGTSHVRYFEDAEEIKARYGSCFKRLTVTKSGNHWIGKGTIA